jgi:transcriptional antiterminator NusG
MSRRFWTEDRIISEIQNLHRNNEDLWYRAMERNHKDLIRACERYFNGWKNAIEAAGLDYDSIKKRTHQVWTEDKILEELEKLRAAQVVLRASKVQQANKKLYLAIIRQFRSFDSAIARLNDQKNKILKYEKKSTTKHTKPPVTSTPSHKQPTQPQTTDENAKDMKIFTVRTRIRSERNVGEAIIKRAESKGVNIGTIQYPTALNGYIFVECDNREELNRLIKNVKHAQGLLNGETTHDEISKYVKTRKSKKNIYEGSRVEITDGQFKGEEAVIQHINERTSELTVELVDEVLKIPIVIYKEQCKILR